MIKLFLLVTILCAVGCANFSRKNDKEKSAEVKKSEISTSSAAPKSIVVNSKDVAILNKMNKAMERYVHKNSKESFTRLCQDIRFDCMVDEKPFPVGKKKMTRTNPPYASGSKMGLQGEKRVQVRYDFYP